MISCTEFIPLYSEFFKYLESRGGYRAVVKYWEYVSDNRLGDTNNPFTLASFIERDGGFFGAVNYWNLTLKEEACDLLQITNPKEKYSYTLMRHCPSKGRLLELQHVEPYPHYCEHCKVIFSRLLEKHGIVYERDHSMVDRAMCSSILYEKGNKPAIDFTRPTPECEVVDMKADENKYLHPGFHISLDIALRYCGLTYGLDAAVSFLKKYTHDYYAPQISLVKEGGLKALEEWIKSVYRSEEHEEYVHTVIDNGRLTVTVDKCPAIEFMNKVNHTPSPSHIETTRTLYATVAEECGMTFVLEYFDIKDGKAKYYFEKED